MLVEKDVYTQIARDAVKFQSRNSPKKLVGPSTVVSFEYVGGNEDIRLRGFYDFTRPAAKYIYPDRLSGADIGARGGAKQSLEMLELEPIPSIRG